MMEREVVVYWGVTGSGKSHRAWQEAGLDAYPKTPTTKFWDGYQGQKHVVIDEFRGAVDISHVLRWFDKYPVIAEVKCSSVVIKAEKIWITSNLHPKDWYPNLDEETKQALLRRLKITHFGVIMKKQKKMTPLENFEKELILNEPGPSRLEGNLLEDLIKKCGF